jgi:ATP-dependent Clp protease adaptor protein ClpS
LYQSVALRLMPALVRTIRRCKQTRVNDPMNLSLTIENTAVAPVATPSTRDIENDIQEPLFHVVLLDDDEHTYEYVIEMLQKLFLIPRSVALEHAVEVDTTGRTIVITCEKPQAEFARDQIQAYGADPRMPKSKGSMSAVIVPVGNTDVA